MSKGRLVKVKALRLGFYGERRRYEGDVFSMYEEDIKNTSEKGKWFMEADGSAEETVNRVYDVRQHQPQAMSEAAKPKKVTEVLKEEKTKKKSSSKEEESKDVL